ncbi:MAG: deoxyribonuclease, partial [Aquiluna sp.]
MTEFIRSRVSYDGLENRPQRYPGLPEPLEVGTYDNHTHLEIADGESP